MSREDGMQLASRALALLIVIWVFVELTYLPGSLLSLVHQLRVRSVLVPQSYGVRSAVASIITLGLRLVGLSVAALWFWNCGPGVQSAFSAPRQGGPPV
jgi:hypothetical protein